MVFLIISLVTGIAYLVLQVYYVFHWRQVPVITAPSSYQPQKRITVVVVAHNEERSIESCINSILKQNFPEQLFEVIIINDRSTDNTWRVLNDSGHSNLKHFSLQDYPSFIHPPAFKKSGIELGVHLASSELIVVTDADCNHHLDWLRTISFVLETQEVVFLTAPVLIKNASGSLEKMQLLENLSLMLITGAGIQSGLHHIANGANMAFKKSAFLKVKGFEGNYNYASGDDMFLIEKMHEAFPDKIAFVKSTSAVVTTDAKHSRTELIQQRLRWAQKNKGLKNHLISRIWLFIGFYHLLILSFLLASLFDVQFILLAVILLLIKLAADYLVVRRAFRFFQIPFIISEFIFLQFTYMMYVVGLGFSMLVGKKGDW